MSPYSRDRRVAVFDIGMPPGIAFLRSLDRAGVPVTAYASSPVAAGRWSRHSKAFRYCPEPAEVDVFTEWLTEEMAADRIDLVAPTSDWIAFATAEALARSGRDASWHPSVDAILDCLMKNRFTTAMAKVGFPTPETELPRTAMEALEAARRLGYPLVLKPRSHLGVGLDRGAVMRSDTELLESFERYELSCGTSTVLSHEHELALPMLQQYLPPDDVDLISVTGCLGLRGEVVALGHSRKLRQWPPKTGVGTIFEAVGEQPFTEEAVDAVRQILGSGIFELEVLVRRDDPDAFWAIDLNPRAFGQITLDMAHGRDLPWLWYRSTTGQCATVGAVPADAPRYWLQAVPLAAGFAVMLALGPSRAAHFRDLKYVLSMSAVGSTRSWRDPLPGILLGLQLLRHPGGLIRPYMRHRHDP